MCDLCQKCEKALRIEKERFCSKCKADVVSKVRAGHYAKYGPELGKAGHMRGEKCKPGVLSERAETCGDYDAGVRALEEREMELV